MEKILLKACVHMGSVLVFCYSKIVFLVVRPHSAADVFGVLQANGSRVLWMLHPDSQEP